ncbi:hypothetical protein F9278_15550 [Streptomyces phaeolivaceus]|uniref:Uncharacterized protein n=1 Tax=Streptomyces phaeolivaceus TaxID=2653200 RepID=A0A5P8K2Y0_9ACTN|nr:hypothetical protein [Streptomyces phaeolivaceus]QFQ97386.1 hypothetical protein F9278_15550 [Streptomyces phaeolivaceus]
MDYSRNGGRGKVVLVSAGGTVSTHRFSEELLRHSPYALPAICEGGCNTRDVAKFLEKILLHGQLQAGTDDYARLADSDDVRDVIRYEAMRVGHVWGLLKVQDRQTTATGAGLWYREALRRLAGESIPEHDKKGSAPTYVTKIDNSTIEHLYQNQGDVSHPSTHPPVYRSASEVTDDEFRVALQDIVSAAKDRRRRMVDRIQVDHSVMRQIFEGIPVVESNATLEGELNRHISIVHAAVGGNFNPSDLVSSVRWIIQHYPHLAQMEPKVARFFSAWEG